MISDCVFSFSSFINNDFSSSVLSITGSIKVDSDDGRLNVGCNELALSLLELSVIVDDSVNDADDGTCCISTESVVNDDGCTCCISIDSGIDSDICISVDSVVGIFSSSFLFSSVEIKSDCDSEGI